VSELLSHLQKIIEFYLCIQMLPANVSWLHFSWTTLYTVQRWHVRCL